MGTIRLTKRHARQIAGVLSCYDRGVVQGTLRVFCYADGMTAYLTKRRIRFFDFKSSPSAACRIRRCAPGSPDTAAVKCPEILRRLRMHGLIKKTSHSDKYYLTVLGKQVVALGLKLKEPVIIPDLAPVPSR
jgi:hypothetical protein